MRLLCALLSQSLLVWAMMGTGWRGEAHRDELDAVVSRGALDAEEEGLDTRFLESFAHVTTLLLLGV
jgi:hypothetical protein